MTREFCFMLMVNLGRVRALKTSRVPKTKICILILYSRRISICLHSL
jgi:hypothetical protein